MKKYGWRFVTLHRMNGPNHPKEKEMQEGKVIIWGGFTNDREKKQKAKEKGKDIPNWMHSSREKQGEIRKPS